MNNKHSAETNLAHTEADSTKRLMKLAMEEICRSGSKALYVIMLLEILMILSWIRTGRYELTIASSGYLFCYIFLIIVSGIMLLTIIHTRKDLQHRCRTLFMAQIVYAMLIILWALSMTWIAAVYRGSFSVLIYITIITVVPTFTFIPPVLWALMELLSAVPVYYLGLKFSEHTNSFTVNFTVLIVISIIAGITLYGSRRNSYLKQLRLEELVSKNEALARRDALTDVLNRRSYNEAIDALLGTVLPEDLVIASFDVNGLKKVNDTLGHEAGDELLIGAAASLLRAFSAQGEIYRIGGDEFAAILHMTQEQKDTADTRLKHETEKWTGKACRLSIAAGFVESRAHPELPVNELEKLADSLMYVDKNRQRACPAGAAGN